MSELYRYKVFISHAWQYNEDYYRLIQMLDSAPRFSYSNYSVPEHDPFERMTPGKLEEKLKDQMVFVDIALFLCGMYANHSDWIQYELDHASSKGIPIVGIIPWGQERTPKAVQDAAVEMVGWNTNSIVDAVRRNIR
jgi:hypothetical protein